MLCCSAHRPLQVCAWQSAPNAMVMQLACCAQAYSSMSQQVSLNRTLCEQHCSYTHHIHTGLVLTLMGLPCLQAAAARCTHSY